MDRILNNALNTFCFLDDILIVSKGTELKQEQLIDRVMKTLNEKNLALKITKCDFLMKRIVWDTVCPKVESSLQNQRPKQY